MNAFNDNGKTTTDNRETYNGVRTEQQSNQGLKTAEEFRPLDN